MLSICLQIWLTKMSLRKNINVQLNFELMCLPVTEPITKCTYLFLFSRLSWVTNLFLFYPNYYLNLGIYL